MSLVDQLVLSIEVSGARRNVDRSRWNIWMTCTNFGPGRGLPGWTRPTLGSKPSPVRIDTSTRRVELQFKATGTGSRVRLLKPWAHSRRLPLFLWMNNIGVPTRRINILTSKAESRVDAACTTRLQRKPLGPPLQIPLHWRVLPAWSLVRLL